MELNGEKKKSIKLMFISIEEKDIKGQFSKKCKKTQDSYQCELPLSLIVNEG